MGNSAPKPAAATEQAPLRVCVIGAGASGVAAAWALAQHPERFTVDVFDPAPEAGGVATSEDVDCGSGMAYVNDGVQAAAPSYRNCLRMFGSVGAVPTPIEMKISFNKDSDSVWSNYRPVTPIVRECQAEIKRLKGVLESVMKWEYLYVAVSIQRLLKWKGFSDDFMNKMIFPLTALFFGTGNQTPNVSSVMFARVFLDPQLRLFEYDQDRLLASTPAMYAFPKLRQVYASLRGAATAASGGTTRFHLGCPVMRVDRTKAESGGIRVCDGRGQYHVFDRLICACDAETAARLLSEKAFWERRVLKSVKYFSDITVTHTDTQYMEDRYDIAVGDPSRGDQYFVHTYLTDPTKIEMSFDLSNYQPQLDSSAPRGRRVFQTIFLDAEHADKWTIGAIDPESVLLRKWWRQFAHTTSHYTGVVPWVRFAQGTSNTYFAGSWTLVNTHEIAVISGLAAAYRLGATYPFHGDELARAQFITYLQVSHGCKYTPPAEDDLPPLPELKLADSSTGKHEAAETRVQSG